MQTFSIERATAGGCHDCAKLLLEQLAEHGVDSSVARLARLLEQVVKDEARGFILLAREDGVVIGVAYCAVILSLEHGGPVAWLEELYVSPSHRERGIGSALVSAVLSHARESGMVAVDLEIDAIHSRAESLYKRFDFEFLRRSRWVRKLRT